MECSQVNTNLLPLKGHYAFFGGGTSNWVVFGPTLMKQLGFSTRSVGLILSLGSLISILGKVGLSMMGDKFRKTKLILVASVLMVTIVNLCFYFIPGPPLDTIQLHCGFQSTIVNLNVRGTLDNFEFKEILHCELFSMGSDVKLNAICHDWYENSNQTISTTTLCKELTADIDIIEIDQDSSILKGLLLSLNDSNQIQLSSQCSSPKNATFFIDCDHLESYKPLSDELWTTSFWLLFISHIIFITGTTTVTSLTDAICFQVLGDKPENYGKQRMFSSIGWGITNIVAGFLVDYYSNSGTHTKNYLPMAIVSSSLLLCSTAFSCILKVKQDANQDYKIENVGEILKKQNTVIFILWTFIFGGFLAINWQYTFWYLEQISNLKQGKYVKSIEGLSSFMGAVFGDGVTFFFAGNITKKIGTENMMSILLIIYSLRVVILSHLSLPVLIVPLAWMDGVLFGFCTTLITTFAAKVSSPGTETTVQAIFGCILDGAGFSVGGLIGGIVYKKIGGAALFNWCAGLAFTVAILLIIFRFISHHSSNKYFISSQYPIKH